MGMGAGGLGNAIGGVIGIVSGAIQTGVGSSQYRKAQKELTNIPFQDAQTQDYLDVVKRKRVGAETGTGTKYQVLQDMIQSNISEQLSGITKFGGSSGSTLAGYGYANLNTGRMMNQLLGSMSQDEQGYLGTELDLNKQLVNRELQLRLARYSVKAGHGADMQKAGMSNIMAGAASLAGTDYTPPESNNNEKVQIAPDASTSGTSFDLEGRARARSYSGGLGGFVLGG